MKINMLHFPSCSSKQETWNVIETVVPESSYWLNVSENGLDEAGLVGDGFPFCCIPRKKLVQSKVWGSPWARTPMLWFIGCLMNWFSSLMRAWCVTGSYQDGAVLLLRMSWCSFRFLTAQCQIWAVWDTLSVTPGVPGCITAQWHCWEPSSCSGLNSLQITPENSEREPGWGVI